MLPLQVITVFLIAVAMALTHAVFWTVSQPAVWVGGVGGQTGAG